MLLNKKAAVIIAALASTVFFAASSCEETEQPSANERENKSRLATYESLVDAQPAEKMSYSPTRATKNFWIKTWDKKGKLSYVYLLNGQGEPFGYYVLEGLPVSYCTGLIPPWQLTKGYGGGYSQSHVVPAPSVDGTYSSASNCSTYYGKDATTGAYIEYTAGFGINPFVYDQPRQQFSDARPLGDATVENVKR